MKAKIVFDFHYNPIDHTGFHLGYIPYDFEVPLLKDFNSEQVLTKITLKNENDFVFSEFEVKEEWYDFYPVLGYSKGWSDTSNTSDFWFSGRCALTDKGVNPNPRVKSIREQLREQALL